MIHFCLFGDEISVLGQDRGLHRHSFFWLTSRWAQLGQFSTNTYDRYFLTLTSFQPLYGKLSDIFSRKSCLLFGFTVFGLGNLFCALSRSINELIAARAFTGVGGAGMSTVVSIIFSDVIPLKDRGTWQG